MRNEALFREIADAIEENPERYDQWFFENETKCGTAYCIAGWAAHIAGVDTNDAEALLGLSETEAWGDDGEDPAAFCGLFDGAWKPHDVLSVPDALRKIGEGALIEDVSA